MCTETDSFCSTTTALCDLEESLQDAIDNLREAESPSDEAAAAKTILVSELVVLRATLEDFDVPSPEKLEVCLRDLYSHTFSCTRLLVEHLDRIQSLPLDKRPPGVLSCGETVRVCQNLVMTLGLLKTGTNPYVFPTFPRLMGPD